MTSGRLEELSLKKLLEIIRREDQSTNSARDIAMQEILRREQVFRERIEGALAEIKNDERLSYPTATVTVNAPLALVQCGLENQIRVLKYVLTEMRLKDGKR